MVIVGNVAVQLSAVVIISSPEVYAPPVKTIGPFACAAGVLVCVPPVTAPPDGCEPAVYNRGPQAAGSAPTPTFNVVSWLFAMVIAGMNPPAAPLSSSEIENVEPLNAVVGTAIISVTSDFAGMVMPVMGPVVDWYVRLPVSTCVVPAPSWEPRTPAVSDNDTCVIVLAVIFDSAIVFAANCDPVIAAFAAIDAVVNVPAVVTASVTALAANIAFVIDAFAISGVTAPAASLAAVIAPSAIWAVPIG